MGPGRVPGNMTKDFGTVQSVMGGKDSPYSMIYIRGTPFRFVFLHLNFLFHSVLLHCNSWRETFVGAPVVA